MTTTVRPGCRGCIGWLVLPAPARWFGGDRDGAMSMGNVVPVVDSMIVMLVVRVDVNRMGI